MVNQITIQFLLKQEVNQLTADIIKLRAALAYVERQRDREAYQKFMESRR